MALCKKKEVLVEIIPWTDQINQTTFSVSESQKEDGSPKEGDMICANPKDESDKWLISKKYFEDNYELA